MRPPTPAQTPITMALWSSIHEETWPPTEAPLQRPFWHLPPPLQSVPSRKFCCRLKHWLAGNSGEPQVTTQEEESQA